MPQGALIQAQALIGLSLKRCTSCNDIKHLDRFYKEKAGLGGRRSRCIPCLNTLSVDWAKRNRSKVLAAAAMPHRKAQAAAWRRDQRTNNREHVLAQQRKHNAARRERWSERVRDRISHQVWVALRGTKARRNVLDLVGWAGDELRAHLERQFVKGMGWHNLDDWHIDHIVPLASFTITGPDDPELRRAWALTNLRPLWARENEAKGAKRLMLI